MKIPKIKEDESLAMWQLRLAEEFNLDANMQELISEVSKQSYIVGVQAGRKFSGTLKGMIKLNKV